MFFLFFSLFFSKVIEIDRTSESKIQVSPNQPGNFVFSSSNYGIHFDNENDLKINDENLNSNSLSTQIINGKNYFYFPSGKGNLFVSSNQNKTVNYNIISLNNYRKVHAIEENDEEFTLNFDTEILQEFVVPANQTFSFNFDRILRFCIRNTAKATIYFSNGTSLVLNTEEIHVINCRTQLRIQSSTNDTLVNICPYASSNIATAIISPIEIRSTRGYTYYSAFYSQVHTVTVSYNLAVTLSYLDPDTLKTVNVTIGPAESKTFTAKSFVLPNAGYIRITTYGNEEINDKILLFRPFFGQPLSTQITEGTIEPSTFSSPKYVQLVKDHAYIRKGQSISLRLKDSIEDWDSSELILSDDQIANFSDTFYGSLWFTIMLSDITDRRCDRIYYPKLDIEDLQDGGTTCFVKLCTKPTDFPLYLEEGDSLTMDIITFGNVESADGIISLTTTHYDSTHYGIQEMDGNVFQLFMVYDIVLKNNKKPFDDESELGFATDLRSYSSRPDIEMEDTILLLIIYGSCVGGGMFLTLILMWICCASYCCPCAKPEDYETFLENKKKQKEANKKQKAADDHAKLVAEEQSNSSSQSSEETTL